MEAPMATKQKEVIFTRVRGLASVIWDPENDRMLAHFNREGLLMTDNPRIIKRLDGMGYRQVSAEEVVAAGLTVPNPKDADRTPQPGRGYTHDGEARPATAMPMPGQDATALNENALFDPDQLPDGPPGAGKRSLVD
jgi:hypothetical protein